MVQRRTAAEIQLELDDVRTGIKKIMLGGQEYTLDTGQTKQINKRGNLKEMMKYKESLESELSLAMRRESGNLKGKGVFTRRGDFFNRC